MKIQNRSLITESAPLHRGVTEIAMYIGNEKDAMLIDGGVSCSQIISRMKENRLNPATIKVVKIICGFTG